MTLPQEFLGIVEKYIVPIFTEYDIDEELKNHITNALTAMYTCGEIDGLCMASAAIGGKFLSALIPNDDPISREIINECKPKEAALIENFRKEMV